MKLFVGIDVSKNSLDCYLNGTVVNVMNNEKGLKKIYLLIKKEIKKGIEIGLILCEATGGYERKLVKFMHAINLPVHVAHANKVRSFAKSKGYLAKTDRIDAQLISQYGETMQVQPDVDLLTENEKTLAELLKRRAQLLEEKIRETNRLDKECGAIVTKSIRRNIKWLEESIEEVEEEIKKLKSDGELDKKIKLLKSIPAIGDITANTLVAFLPELGSKDEKEIVALIGLAPFNKDSGTSRGKRCIQGGRTIVRNALYMSALSSVRYYKEMKEFYLRLRRKGKPAKLALIAVARKLLIVANSVARRGTAWCTQFVQQTT